MKEFEKRKVAIYVRVSTHWQVDKDSLQVQRRELIAYAKHVLGIDDYVIFEDAGYSAKNTDRPDYQHMLDRLKTGEFSHLLVWKIDRINRNLLDFAEMYTALKKVGVAFVSKNEQFDTSSAIGEAMLKIILVFAELERNMTSERVTAVMISRANNGQWNGGRIPYGYDYNKETKSFSLNNAQAEVVKRIFNLYLDRQSVLSVTRTLNDEHVPTGQYSKQWTTTTTHKILTNVFYTGSYRYNVRSQATQDKKPESEWIIIPNHHKAIVSEALFESVQQALKRNRRGQLIRETYVKKNVHIFAGLLECGTCGGNMSATLDRQRADGWRPSIYGCHNKRNNSGKCPDSKYVSDVSIGPVVFNIVANILHMQNDFEYRLKVENRPDLLLLGTGLENYSSINKKCVDGLISALNKKTEYGYMPASIFDPAGASATELELVESQIRKTETALSRLQALYLYSEDAMPQKDYVAERESLANELEAQKSRRSELLGSKVDQFIESEQFEAQASFFLMVKALTDSEAVDYENVIRNLDPNIPKAFLRKIISKIIITRGKVTEIVFANATNVKIEYRK